MSSPAPSRSRIFLVRVLWVVWNIIVIEGSVLPPRRIPSLLLHLNDKAVHAGMYFILFLISLFAFARKPQSRPALAAFLYCALMGVLTECLQLNVPGRSADLLDWLADAGGAAAAWLLLWPLFIRGKREIL